MTTATRPNEVAASVDVWLSAFGDALAANDPARAAALFATDGFWRDLVAFTWNLKTFEGRAEISDMLTATLAHVQPTGWKITSGREPAEAGGITEAWIDFETAVGRGHGHLRLRDGQAWTLLTTLYELKGYEEPKGPGRPKGAEHGINRDRISWQEKREYEAQELGFTEQPYVLIVGGGQAGIGLAARLRQLNVPTIVIDKRVRPGDQWRSRYKSLCLHDPVWYDHMPYLKFPDRNCAARHGLPHSSANVSNGRIRSSSISENTSVDSSTAICGPATPSTRFAPWSACPDRCRHKSASP